MPRILLTATAITAIALPSLFALRTDPGAVADDQHFTTKLPEHQTLRVAAAQFNEHRLGYVLASWKATSLKVHTTSAELSSIVLPMASKVVLPLAHWTHITSGFGPRAAPCAGCSTVHKGIDVGVHVGTPVQSIAAGVVVNTGTNGAMGQYIDVLHNIKNKLVLSHYQHLSRTDVAVGDAVKAAQTIGLSGQSGVGTGPHLHFEIEVGTTTYDTTWKHSVDPDAWLAGHVKGYHRSTHAPYTYAGPDGTDGEG